VSGRQGATVAQVNELSPGEQYESRVETGKAWRARSPTNMSPTR